jgi:P-type E1-E2 ATPase
MISGKSITQANESSRATEKVMKILDCAQSVLIYRTSPAEKAKVVKMVMDNDPKAFTLAVGDGANDINMI